MTLFIDADSCPVRIREIICKTAQRLQVQAIFVANRLIPIPKNSYCTTIVTEAEEQAADIYILDHATQGDMVITRDIPLAKQLVDAHIKVMYTANNIGERLSIRNFMYELSVNGLAPERTKAFGKKEVMEFAQALDRETQRLLKNVP